MLIPRFHLVPTKWNLIGFWLTAWPRFIRLWPESLNLTFSLCFSPLWRTF